MKIEDRLSDAMHDYADAIEPSADSWPRISARFDDGAPPRRPCRGRLVFAGVAITLVVVLIAVLAVRDDGPTNKVATNPEPDRVDARPSSRWRVRSGCSHRRRTGHWSPWISDRGSCTRPSRRFPASCRSARSHLGASPRSTAPVPEAASARNREPRWEPSISTPEPATRIVSGAVSPVVSPDGRFVAYGIRCDGKALSVTLGYTDLRNGMNYRIDPFPRSAQVRLTSLEPLAWAGDSKRLLFRVVSEGDTVPQYYLGRLWPQGDDTRPVKLDGIRMAAAAFIDGQMAAIAEDVGDGSTVTITSLYLPCSAPCTLGLSTTEPPAFHRAGSRDIPRLGAGRTPLGGDGGPRPLPLEHRRPGPHEAGGRRDLGELDSVVVMRPGGSGHGVRKGR